MCSISSNLKLGAQLQEGGDGEDEHKPRRQPQEEDKQSAQETGRSFGKTRIHVALLGLAIAAVNCYAQATFCMAIVEMVVPSDERLVESAAVDQLSCPIELRYRNYYDTWRFEGANSTGAWPQQQPPQARSEPAERFVRFNWDSSQQGVLLGAFAFGMAPLQVFAGRLAEVYGAKWVLFGACLGTALTNLTIVPLAKLSFALLALNRVLMGVSQAGMEPGLMCLLADWLPPHETGFFISMLLFAMCIGFFFGSLLSGYILAQQTLGWPLTFYVSGGLNLVVALIWLVYADSWPRTSRFASNEEVAHIESEQEKLRSKAKQSSQAKLKDLESGQPQQIVLAATRQNIVLVAAAPASDGQAAGEPTLQEPRNEEDEDNSLGKSRESGQAPWRNILTTRSVWAFIVCKFSIRWCADVISIELPTYLANVLHVSIKINGILNSVSSALFAIFSFLAGWLVNELVNQTTSERWQTSPIGQVCDKTTLRVITQSIASFGSALTLFLMTTYDCNLVLSMSMLLLFSCVVVMGTGGEFQIPYDMTQRYPGTLHGMACALSVSGWLAPPLIGAILGDQPTSRARWNTVWYLTASIAVFGGLVFLLFADANPRDFDAASQKPERTKRRRRRQGQFAQGGDERALAYVNAACKLHDQSPPPLAKRQPNNTSQPPQLFFDTKLIKIRQTDQSDFVLPTSCCPANLDRPPKEFVFAYTADSCKLGPDARLAAATKSQGAFLGRLARALGGGEKATTNREASEHICRLPNVFAEPVPNENCDDEPLKCMTRL